MSDNDHPKHLKDLTDFAAKVAHGLTGAVKSAVLEAYGVPDVEERRQALKDAEAIAAQIEQDLGMTPNDNVRLAPRLARARLTLVGKLANQTAAGAIAKSDVEVGSLFLDEIEGLLGIKSALTSPLPARLANVKAALERLNATASTEGSIGHFPQIRAAVEHLERTLSVSVSSPPPALSIRIRNVAQTALYAPMALESQRNHTDHLQKENQKLQETVDRLRRIKADQGRRIDACDLQITQLKEALTAERARNEALAQTPVGAGAPSQEFLAWLEALLPARYAPGTVEQTVRRLVDWYREKLADEQNRVADRAREVGVLHREVSRLQGMVAGRDQEIEQLRSNLAEQLKKPENDDTLFLTALAAWLTGRNAGDPVTCSPLQRCVLTQTKKLLQYSFTGEFVTWVSAKMTDRKLSVRGDPQQRVQELLASLEGQIAGSSASSVHIVSVLNGTLKTCGAPPVTIKLGPVDCMAELYVDVAAKLLVEQAEQLKTIKSTLGIKP